MENNLLKTFNPDAVSVDPKLDTSLVDQMWANFQRTDNWQAFPHQRLAEWAFHHGLSLGLASRNSTQSPATPPTNSGIPGFIKPDTDTHVFFYEQDFYVLSNFSAFSLTWKTLHFPTSEHAYHWEKFQTNVKALDGSTYASRRSIAAEAVRNTGSAHEAFKEAKRWEFLRRGDWDEVKVDIMRDILRAKVNQHSYVHRKLLDTGDRILVEDSWRDRFWGWGPNRDGQNMLGILWMEIRDELRRTENE